MSEGLLNLLHVRKGHFRLESGHHGDLWLDLELLCLRPKSVLPFAARLAARLAPHKIDAVCGPLVEGAFVALMVACELDVDFFYAERFEQPQADTLFPVKYQLPGALRKKVRGKRVALVNDVINAGSAVRGAYADLIVCGAQPVAIGSLLVLGDSAAAFAKDKNIALEKLASLPNILWRPSDCPLCASRIPLEDGARIE